MSGREKGPQPEPGAVTVGYNGRSEITRDPSGFWGRLGWSWRWRLWSYDPEEVPEWSSVGGRSRSAAAAGDAARRADRLGI